VRLLVVEDDPALRRGLREGLVAQGFAVDGVESAELAESQLALNPYDLVLLDLGLPGRNGLDFLRSLRADGNPLPVLVLTARDSVTDHVTGLDGGADDYLRKPFAFVELVARIRALLRRGALIVEPVLRIGDVELDPARRAVRVADVEVVLTGKELAILEFLMRHAGLLVTRSMILEHCWDESYDGLSNLVDVHVGRLRRKLEAAGSHVPLRTLRGAGFLFGEAPA
jgi:DNA-binding response OmpR family regulator